MPLTKDEIKSLLGEIENERVERTFSTDNAKKMSETICAFANDIRNTKKPGYFMIGAYDNGMVSILFRCFLKKMELPRQSFFSVIIPPSRSLSRMRMS